MLKTLRVYFAFSLAWFLLVAVGVPLGFSLGTLLTRDFSDREGTLGIGILLLLIVIGLFVGLGEWIALNTRLKAAWTWIPATAVGFSFGCVITYLILAFVGQALLHLNDNSGKYYAAYQWLELRAAFLGAGLLTGALQWATMGRIERSSLKWLLASGLSFASAFTFAYLITDVYWIDRNAFQTYFPIIFGSFLGLLTGISAGPLVLQPKSQAS